MPVQVTGIVTQEVMLTPGSVIPSTADPLKIDVNPFFYEMDGVKGTYVGVLGASLTDDDVNYVYLASGGTLTINTTGYPAGPHIRLATVTTSGGVIVNMLDSRAVLNSGVSGGMPGAHAITHQSGGADQINVLNLAGRLADPQLADQLIEVGEGRDEAAENTTASWEEKLRVDFNDMEVGNYLIFYNAEVGVQVEGTVQARCQYDDTINVAQVENDEPYFRSFSGFRFASVPAGNHHVDLDWGRGSGSGTPWIRRARIAMFRMKDS